ncbi:MAG: hypothetical protein QOF54_1586, partial [Solirubrobacteraceae bacterium]|nr:hypothetical protein [Solirubrobacteraceae bacterium]
AFLQPFFGYGAVSTIAPANCESYATS